MKTQTKILLLAMALMALSAITQADEVGNGGDPIELVYIEAAAQVRNKLNPLQDNMVFVLRIDPDVKDWLLEKVETRSRLGHLKRLARFLERDTMQFVEGPCVEPSGALRPITYIGDEYAPRVCISRSLNQTTTVEQATALLLHELGHGTGEKDHIFLSDFGRQMATSEATSGIRLREDGKQVIVELTNGQLYPGGYSISSYQNDIFSTVYNKELSDAACQIYGYDGSLTFTIYKSFLLTNQSWKVLTELKDSKGALVREPQFGGLGNTFYYFSSIVCYKNL
ncbi:MAG: hypothetical protein HYY62_08055 [Deltaproteobacteria bacterium]|nr:hypothetical protein [Deltaproteobacteria bacterium]